MATTQEIRSEAMADILDGLGISATPEQIQSMVKDFSNHLDMEQEMSSYQHAGNKEECSKCKSLQSKIVDLEKENDVFRNSVKRRRHADRVWTQGDSVMYE
jgi:hypothetical protein